MNMHHSMPGALEGRLPQQLHEELQRVNPKCFQNFINGVLDSLNESDHYQEVKRFIALGYNIGMIDSIDTEDLKKLSVVHIGRRRMAQPSTTLCIPNEHKIRFLDSILAQMVYAYWVESRCAKGNCSCHGAAQEPVLGAPTTLHLHTKDRAVRALQNPLVQCLLQQEVSTPATSRAFEEVEAQPTRLKALARQLTTLPLEQDPLYNSFDETPDFNWEARGLSSKLVDPLPDRGDQPVGVRHEARVTG